MYDWVYGQFDVIEGVIYLLCFLEFNSYCLFYDWFFFYLFLDGFVFKQCEFVCFELIYIIILKCWFKFLVINNIVDGWDDLCMFILCGMCCCGYLVVVI